jgi:hypothetical protein
MNQADILNWLDSKAGQVSTIAQVDQFKLELRVNLAGLSVDVAGQKSNAVTLLYSGSMGGGTNGLKNWQVAEKIGTDSNGQVRTIGQTELGKFLNSQAFDDTIKRALGNKPDLVTQVMDGTTQNNVRTPNGVWDWVSERFTVAAPGEIRALSPFATDNAVFTQTEIKAALASNAPSIEGIARQTLLDFRSELITKGATEADALSKIRDVIALTAADNASKLEIGRNSAGNLLVGSDRYFAGTQGYAGSALPLESVSRLTGGEVMNGLLLDNKPAFVNTVELIKNSDVLGALGRGAVTAAEGATTGLNKLGTAGIVLSGALAFGEAKAAVAEGDTTKAAGIAGSWAGELAAGFATGVAAAEVAGAYFWWLELEPGLGTAAHLAITTLAGIGGGVVGAVGVDKVKSFFSTVMRQSAVATAVPMGTGDVQAIFAVANEIARSGAKFNYDFIKTAGASGSINPPVVAPEGLGTPTRDSALFFGASGDHSVTVKSGGTVSDIWLKQKNNPGGFANDQEFYEAVLVSNPGITDINKVQVGQTIYVPQKQYDGSVTYHYAGGASVNTNKANGEYYMEVPNSSADGGSTVYERKLAGSEYVVRQTVTNATGETVFYGSGKQETPDSELKDWFNYAKYEDAQNNLLKTVSSQVNGAGNLLEVTNNLDGTGTIKAYDEQLVETDSATFIKTGGMSATTGTLTKLIDGQSVVFDASFGNFDPMSAPGLNFFKLTGIDLIGETFVLNDSMIKPLFSAGDFTLANVLTTGEAAPLGLSQVKALVAAGDSTGANPTGLAPTPTTDNKPWYESDGAQKLGGVLTSMQSLIASLKSGKPLAIATDTFNLAMSASPNPDLKDTGQYLNYANSLVNFAGAFERGDDLSAFMSGASIVKQYMQSQASTALDALTHAIGTAAGTGAVTQLQNASTKWNDTTKLQEEFAKNPALTQNPDAQSKLANYVDAKDLFQKLDVGLNILSVHNAFSTGGNEVGKVQAVAFLLAAMDAQWALWAGPVGWAMAGISIIGSLFGSEPDIWGTAYAVNDANGATRAQILENHDDGGLHAVAALDDLIDQLEDNSVKDGLGLIAQRLPGVQVWYDGRPNVFTLWFEDAQTGVFTARGYDKDGKYLGELDAQSNLIAPDVNQASYFGNMGQHFATAADVASAVVPLWMQQTIDQQAALGLQYAGKSTELRAKEQGQLLATNPGNALPGNAGNLDDSSTQTARLITLDWDDNGSIAVATRAQGHGVLVDIDNDGSAEETDWIGTHDAILVLDHNGNGKVDNGHELFNDAQINTALRGLHALDEFDANGDGKITASDPVYNQLKVWLDIQHDGQMQAFETLSLAAAGISELGINSGQFVRNGEADLMTTTALTADSAGTIVHVEGNNLRVLKETGDTLLMVSALADFAKSTDAQVRDSHTRLSANGSLTVVNELMDGVEDTAIVVSVEQLLKNDTSSAGTTSISMVGGAFGGTVSLDAAQGTIRFTPSAEFSGEGSFRYVVTDAQGQKTTGKALVHVAGVNDAPVLTNLGATRAAGSADFKTTGSTITMPTGNVPKLESPARLGAGRGTGQFGRGDDFGCHGQPASGGTKRRSDVCGHLAGEFAAGMANGARASWHLWRSSGHGCGFVRMR